MSAVNLLFFSLLLTLSSRAYGLDVENPSRGQREYHYYLINVLLFTSASPLTLSLDNGRMCLESLFVYLSAHANLETRVSYTKRLCLQDMHPVF